MSAWTPSDTVLDACRAHEEAHKKLVEEGGAKDAEIEDEYARKIIPHAELRWRYFESKDAEVWIKMVAAHETLRNFLEPKRDQRIFRAVKTLRVTMPPPSEGHPKGTVRIEFTANPNPFFSATKFYRELDYATGALVSMTPLGWKDKSDGSFFDMFDLSKEDTLALEKDPAVLATHLQFAEGMVEMYTANIHIQGPMA